MEEDISGTGQPVWVVDMRLEGPTGHTEIMAVRNALHVGNAAPIRLSYWPEERCKCGELIFMSAHSAHEREAKSSQRVERLKKTERRTTEVLILIPRQRVDVRVPQQPFTNQVIG